MEVVGYCSLYLGAATYNRYLSKWSYRKIWIFSHACLVAFNLLDLVWVTRTNIALGIPDKAFLFGEELLAPMLDRIMSMPMYILIAEHMPPGAPPNPSVEAGALPLTLLLLSVAQASRRQYSR